MAAIEEARVWRYRPADQGVTEIVIALVRAGSVSRALTSLGIAVKLVSRRETARIAIEPWLVEMALERLDGRRITVWKAARTPWKVRWPDWREYRG